MVLDELQQIIEALEELGSDSTVPKNIKTRINEIMAELKGADETCIKINKALNMLDDISDDNNIQPYSRTQIWNIVSMLESIHS